MNMVIPKQDLYIWWTNQRDTERADASDRTNWPAELEDELRSRMGRNGRGSLWIPTQWDWADLGIEWQESHPMFIALGNHYGGIVFRREYLPLFKDLTGLITDFDMNRIQGEWNNLPYELQP
ncbi:hypothetical protein D3C87_1111250 [compost metagenome]